MSAELHETYDHWSVAVLTVTLHFIYSHFWFFQIWCFLHRNLNDGIAKDHIFKQVLTFFFNQSQRNWRTEPCSRNILPYAFTFYICYQLKVEICYVFIVGLSYSLQF